MNRTTPFTVAILGAGGVAQNHGQAFAALGPEVQILGVAEIDAKRRQDFAARFGTEGYADYRELLEKGPDLVVVCLPHALHTEVGVAAAEAGCHLLMEKPLAPTLAQAQTIVESCRHNHVYLATGFVHRYRVELQQAHQLIRSGRLGQVMMITDVFGLPGGRHIPSWVWANHNAGGGILFFTGIHSLDWQSWLVGSPVVEVFAQSTPHAAGSDAESAIVATMRYANGCIGTLVGNQPAYRVTPRSRALEIYGTQACLRLRSGEYLEYSDDDQSYKMVVERDDPFTTQARDLVTRLRNGQAPWITGEDGLRAQQLCQAIFESAATRKPISIEP